MTTIQLIKKDDFEFQVPEKESVKDVNTSSVEINELWETAPRFFDKNNDEISNIDRKDPWVDIQMMSIKSAKGFKKPEVESSRSKPEVNT